MMRIRVLLFAGIATKIGAEFIDLDLSPDSTVNDVIQRLGRDFPESLALLSRSRVAINRAYVSLETTVNACDEVAVIPPVSGG